MPNCRHDGTLPAREGGDAPCYACHSSHLHGGRAYCKHCGKELPPGNRRSGHGLRCRECRRAYEAQKQAEARALRGQYRDRKGLASV